MKRILFIFFLAVFFLTCGVVYAKPYYVAQNSSGDGSGSSYANRMSVSSHNSGSFSPGDTIYLCDTIISGIEVPSSGVENNVITYKGNYAGHAAELDMSSDIMAIKTMGEDFLTFDNIEISDGLEGIGNWSGGLESTNITITNCTIHGMTNRGILATDWVNVVVGGDADNGNTIYNCGGGTAGGDVNFSRTENVVVSYNTLYGNGVDEGVDGIVTERSSNFVIEYNKIYDHAREDGIDIKKNSHNIVIRYNEIYGHTAGQYPTGITIQLGSYDVQIYGNRIHDNGQAGIQIKRGIYASDGDMTDIRIWDNEIYNNSAGVYISSSGDKDTDIIGIKIYDNVFAENGNKFATHGGGVWLKTGQDHEIHHNTFYKNTGPIGGRAPYLQVFLDDNVKGATFDYNTYFYPGVSGQDMFDMDGKLRTHTEWKMEGYDVNTTEGTEGTEKYQKMIDPDNNENTPLAKTTTWGKPPAGFVIKSFQ